MNEATGSAPVQENSLRDIYYIFFRHIKKTIFFFLFVVTVVTAGTFLSPEIYVSQAKLLLRVGRESASVDPTAAMAGAVIGVSQTREQEINTSIEIIQSRQLAEQVVDAIGVEQFIRRPDEVLLGSQSTTGKIRDTVRTARQDVRAITSKPESLLTKLDLYDQLRDRDRAILVLMQNLKVRVEKSSPIITLEYEAPSPTLSHAICSKLIEFYIEKHIAVYRSQSTYKFFDEQTKKLLEKLTATEEQLREMKNQSGISSLTEQRSILLRRIGDIETNIQSEEAQRASLTARIAQLEKMLSATPEMVQTEKMFGNEYMRSELYKLQIQEEQLRSQYTDDHYRVKEIRRQIEEAKKHLTEEPQISWGTNDNFRQLEINLRNAQADIQACESRIAELRTQLATTQQEITVFNSYDFPIMQLTREMEMKEADYKKYTESLEQARIDADLQIQKISNVSVVQDATFPMKPIRPRKMLNILLGVFMGIFGGIGVAFFAEFLDHTIKNADDVAQRLKLRTLAAIPLK